MFKYKGICLSKATMNKIKIYANSEKFSNECIDKDLPDDM
jgi:hypothetical protein